MFPHLFFSITQYPYFWVSGKIGVVQNLGEKIVKEIKRATRKQYSSEEKVRIVLMDYGAKTALPRYAVERAFPKT